MSSRVNIRKEAEELRGLFPNFTQDDFITVRGNPVAVVYFTTGLFNPDFQVGVEFPPSYPDSPPNAYVLEPNIDPSCPHIWDADPETGGAKICFIKPSKWRSYYTAYDAAGMIKSWVYAYINWEKTGNWDWDEEDHTL